MPNPDNGDKWSRNAFSMRRMHKWQIGALLIAFAAFLAIYLIVL